MGKKKNIPKAESIRVRIVKYMKDLGTYKVEFSDIISIYADLLHEYAKAKQEFIEQGEQYEVETAAGGTKKSGTVSAMEVLRKDISAYSDRLMLNPKSLDRVSNEQTGVSALDKIFSEFEDK